MRVPRITDPNGGYYHVLSRVVDRRMVLCDKEKERFRKLMRKTEAFSGVEILTYAILDNHFHIELYVPPRSPVDDTLFEVRLSALYDATMVRNTMKHVATLRETGQDEAAELAKANHVARMYDLSAFCKTLKQRFTQSFNKRHGRKGTLWEERFKSIMVEGKAGALSAVAAYIDLNPVKAGIVSDSCHYRYSGYGEAVGGSRAARRGLARVMRSLGLEGGWQSVHAEYRKLLYVRGEKCESSGAETPGKPGFSHRELQRVLDEGGKLTLQQALHCRVRYFTDGLVLGSRAYVDEMFHRYRDRFSPKRSSGTRGIAHADLGDLFTARRLQREAITVPAH